MGRGKESAEKTNKKLLSYFPRWFPFLPHQSTVLLLSYSVSNPKRNPEVEDTAVTIRLILRKRHTHVICTFCSRVGFGFGCTCRWMFAVGRPPKDSLKGLKWKLGPSCKSFSWGDAKTRWSRKEESYNSPKDGEEERELYLHLYSNTPAELLRMDIIANVLFK